MPDVPSTMSQAKLSETNFRDMYQGIEKGSMAYKLLSSMGWKEGEGLGANKQGISVHVKAHKKFDNAGVGLKEASARAQDWTLEMCKFSGILKGLQEVVNTAAAAPDVAEADLGVKSKKSKKRKKCGKSDGEVAQVKQNSSIYCARSDAHEAAAMKLSAHAVRYAKRARNKLVKGYSQTDLAAILGQTVPTGSPTPVIAEISNQQQEVEERLGNEPAEQPLKDRHEVHMNKQCSGDPMTVAGEPARDSSPNNTESGWWTGMFARGAKVGTTGSGWEREKKLGRNSGFSEQDQTDLYNSAQGGKSQGKQGLGLGSRPGELKKRAWKGKKMKFDSVEEDEAEDPEKNLDHAEAQTRESTDPNSDMLPGGAVIVWANGVRPEWFQRRERSHLQPAQVNIDRRTVDGELRCGDEHDCTQAASIKLSEKQRQKCLRVAARMLKKSTGNVKLKDAVEKAIAALHLESNSDLGCLRKKVKSVLKKGDAWCIEKGVMVPAVCA